MRLLKKWTAIVLIGMLVGALAGCGNKNETPDVGAPPSADDQASVAACQAANQLMLGKGIALRGHKLIFKGVPLSVREPELLAALPDKELLRLAVKRGTLATEQDLHSVLDLSASGDASAATILTTNRQLKAHIEAQTAEHWRQKASLWARIWRKTKSSEEWQSYLEKQQEKNKTTIVLKR